MRPCWTARITLNPHSLSLKNPVPESMVLATMPQQPVHHSLVLDSVGAYAVPNVLVVCGVVQRSAKDSPGELQS